jgi:SMI1 / KNR4 family (SUKH-1)
MKLARLLADGYYLQPGAKLDDIRRIEATLGITLPADYVELITWSNGGDFIWGERYFRLRPVEAVVSRTFAIDVPVYMPGTVVIGDDAGEIIYLYDYRSDPASPTLIQVDLDFLFEGRYTVQGATLTEALYAWSGLTAARRSLLSCLEARLLALSE